MPPVPIVAVGRAEKRAMRCQATARGFLVRRRVALWRAQNSATVRLQATARGLASRRKHFATLQAQRLERRVAQLEAALRSERRQREVSEAFLRRPIFFAPLSRNVFRNLGRGPDGVASVRWADPQNRF